MNMNDPKKDTQKREAYTPKYVAQALLLTLLLVAIVVMIAVLLNKKTFSKNFDLTTNKINSLSLESEQFLNSLETNVEIICIPGSNLADNYCDSTVDLVNLYEKTNSHIINRGTLDLRDRALLEKIQPSGFSRLILISATNKSEIAGAITESKLTNALVNLIKFKKTVYFLSGHGEPQTSASNAERNYADVVSSLESRAYSVQTLNLIDGDIPSEAQVIIAGDNSIPYDTHTESELTKFVARGGKLILIVNPYRTQGLDEFYHQLNLKPDNVLLTLNKNTSLGKQLAKQNFLRPPVVMSDFNTDSPISNIIAQAYGAQASIPIDGARPFTILDSTNAKIKTEPMILMYAVQAAPITVTDSERDKIDLNAPFLLHPDKNFDVDASWPIGFDVKILNASEMFPNTKKPEKHEDDKSEVVIYGFSLVNQYSTQIRVTEELIPLTVAQLYEDKELISIPAKDYAPKQFNYSRNPGAWVLLFASFLPIATAVAGFVIWIRRRKG